MFTRLNRLEADEGDLHGKNRAETIDLEMESIKIRYL